MLNTPDGMRSPEDYEHVLLCYGSAQLAGYLLARIRAEERGIADTGLVIKSVSDNSPFHVLNSKDQLASLFKTTQIFFDKQGQFANNQLMNAALEGVYSCIFYEVKKEISRGHVIRRTNHVRSYIYYAWEGYFAGSGGVLKIDSSNLDDWLCAIDKLAAHVVFDREFAKQLPSWVGPIWTPEEGDLVSLATYFFENLVVFPG